MQLNNFKAEKICGGNFLQTYEAIKPAFTGFPVRTK